VSHLYNNIGGGGSGQSGCGSTLGGRLAVELGHVWNERWCVDWVAKWSDALWSEAVCGLGLWLKGRCLD
jgi:hypothetical protein